MKQAVCKTVALGPVGSSPTLPTLCRSPSTVEELPGRQWAGNTGLQVRLLCAALMGMCANRAGSLSRKQVIRKGLGVRIPPSPLLSRFGRIGKCTCLLSRGRLVRHPGSGPGSGAHNNIGMCCNWKTGWSQKPAAIGHCGFDSHHVDFNYHIYFHQNLMQS